MASVRLSVRAKADLKSIAEYTVHVWGGPQTVQYIAAIQSHCQQLADLTLPGRSCARLSPGLLRSEYLKHVVFYRPHGDGILISRILHQSMLPERHTLE